MLTVRKMESRAMQNRKNIQNKQSEAIVYLYEFIGGWMGIDHQEWIKDFNEIDADTIHLRVDSDGGDIFAARAMKTAVMQHKATVIAHIDGIAASAASFLSMGADEIEIVEGGFFMIHNARSFLDILGYFDVDDLTNLIIDIGKEKDLHTKINEAIANDYVKKTKNNQEKVLEWMAAETWFTAKEAVENGFADRIYDGEPVEGSYDLSVFANTPKEVLNRNKRLSKRTIEKALRDAGISNKESKKILAEGYKDDQRDVEDPDPSAVKTAQRDVEAKDQRDVEDDPEPTKDRTAELLTRAEVLAPSPRYSN